MLELAETRPMKLGTIALLSVALASAAACGNDSPAPTCSGSGCECVDSACSCTVGADCKADCGTGDRSLDCADSTKCQGQSTGALTLTRSEERRVGKEGRSRWSPYH